MRTLNYLFRAATFGLCLAALGCLTDGSGLGGSGSAQAPGDVEGPWEQGGNGGPSAGGQPQIPTNPGAGGSPNGSGGQAPGTDGQGGSLGSSGGSAGANAGTGTGGVRAGGTGGGSAGGTGGVRAGGTGGVSTGGTGGVSAGGAGGVSTGGTGGTPLACEAGGACLVGQVCSASCGGGEISCVCVDGVLFCGGCSGDETNACPSDPQGKSCESEQSRCAYGATSNESCTCTEGKWFCSSLAAPADAADCPAQSQLKMCGTRGAFCATKDNDVCICRGFRNSSQWFCGT